jgi:hypothetical protein
MNGPRTFDHWGFLEFGDEPTRPDACWPEALMASGDPFALFHSNLVKVQTKCHELRDKLQVGHWLDIELAAYELVTACLVLSAIAQVLRLHTTNAPGEDTAVLLALDITRQGVVQMFGRCLASTTIPPRTKLHGLLVRLCNTAERVLTDAAVQAGTTRSSRAQATRG